MNSKRIVLMLLLACTALILRIRGNADVIVPSVPLELLPRRIVVWRGTDVPLSAEVLSVLGDGHFLERTYRVDPAGPNQQPEQDASVDLLVAYFPSQRSGQSIHSPQNCLPGAGWTFQSSGKLDFADNAGKPHRVGEYVVTNGTARLEVLYWYRSRGVDIANDYAAKGYLMVQSIRDRRTDGALIRVATPMREGESQASARERVVHFTGALDPLLPPFIPE